jgi:hypothetical protein
MSQSGLITFGIVIEFLQLLTGYRSFEVLDMAADAAGVSLGLLLACTPMGYCLVWIERRTLEY